MPSISRFYGIAIYIYFQQREHHKPHFHARYGNKWAVIDIQTLNVIKGGLTPKALSRVRSWAGQHRGELLEIWKTQRYFKIQPLDERKGAN